MVKEAVKERWHVISTNTPVDQASFLEAVDLIFEANYFAFNDEFYKMKIGTTMGGRASVDVCDLVMDCLLDKCLAIHKNEIIMVKKFVDDLFLIVKTSAIPSIIETFNKQQKLKFTSEREIDGKLAYLDLLLIHTGNQIYTKWYKKETTSNRMLCFNSAHSLNQRLNVATNFVKRVFTLTHPHNQDECTNIIQKQLRECKYPTYIIRDLIQKYCNPNADSRLNMAFVINNDTHLGTNMTIKTIQNIPGLTNKIVQLAKNMDENISIMFSYKNVITVRGLHSKLKTPINIFDTSHNVYMIPCSICALLYIGISLQKLAKRIYQHNFNHDYLHQLRTAKIYSESFREKEIDRLTKTSALLKHSFDHEHYFDFNNVKIIDKQSNYFKLKFSEMIHIKNNECCNKRSDIEGLSTTYWGILDLIKNCYKN